MTEQNKQSDTPAPEQHVQGMEDRDVASFQDRVEPWMMACFGAEISADKLERNDRFIEEALELVQASDYPKERALALVDYVYGRDQGEINQEVGGVMVTLAAHCLAHGVDMQEAAETELARIWTKVKKIRAKQKAKPTGSALPIAMPSPETNLRVKPLEWRALAVTDREATVADSILGKWEVWHFPGGGTYIMKPGEYQGTVYEDGYEEAKAYMERVYQRRVAPALAITEGSDNG